MITYIATESHLDQKKILEDNKCGSGNKDCDCLCHPEAFCCSDSRSMAATVRFGGAIDWIGSGSRLVDW